MAERDREPNSASRLRADGEFFRTTLASIGDGVISTDADGRVTFLNGVAELLTGWPQAEAVGRPLDDVFHIINEHTRQPVENPALRALTRGVIVGLANHTILISRNGTQRPIDDSAAPIRSADGPTVGAVLVFRDVTERKRAEDDRIRLAAIIESSDDAIISKTLDGIIRTWNAAAERLFGYTTAEAVGKPITLIIPPDRLDEERDILARLRRGDRVDHFETVRLAKDGHRVDISLTVSPLCNSEGQLTGASKVVRDITARKASEAAARASETQRRLLAELTAATQPLTDPDEIMSAAARLLAEHLMVDRCIYAEIEDESTYVITGDHTRGVSSIVGRWPVAAFGVEHLRMMRADEPYVVSDSDTDPRIGPDDLLAFRATSIRAVICVPLHKSGKFTAAMAVHQQNPRTWTPEEVVLVTTVVGRCWEALERARVARKVETERARLAQVFDHAPSFMCVLRGPDHVFERANERYYELLGRRDLLGRSVREAVPEVINQGFIEILDRVYRTGEPFVATAARITLQRPNGLEERMLEFVYQPIRDAVGEVTGILAQGIDLTDRERAQQDLARVTAESERQRRMFDTALSHTVDFVYLFDLDGRFTYVNHALLALWEKDLPGAIGKNFFDLDYPPELASRLQRQIQEVIATRAPLRDETPYTSAVGTHAYEYIFVPVFGADGRVEAVAGSTRDITERKQNELALRQSEERYRVLATATSDVVYRMTADWSELFPVDGRDLIASNARPTHGWMEKNLPAFEHARVRDAIALAVATKRPFELEHQVIRPEGTLGWTLSRAAPILDDRGEIVEWFGTARDVTERKRVESESIQMAEALGLALSAGDLGMWEWDPATDAMILSARAAEIYGVDRDGPHRREALRGLLHPDDRDLARAAAERAVAERADYDIEYRLTQAAGPPLWVAVRGRGVYDSDGKLTRMLGVVQNVTDRRRAEDELRDIKSRMEAALAAGAIGTWSWDVPSDRFFGDPSLACIFGVEPQVVAGGPIAGLLGSIHPADRDRVSEQIDRALRAGEWYEADYRVAQRDGVWRWVTARGQVERDASGRAVRFPGVVVDVTERKRAEDELARVMEASERRKRLYETALSNTPDLVYVFDLDHRFTYANEALLRMWGKTWEEAIGKSCLELGYEGWHASKHDQEIEQVRATKAPIRGEVPFTGTGGRRVYDYIFVPVFGATGEVEAVAGTTRDITDRQAMEFQLREADRKKDDFLALLAHELRNPLAPLRNGLQVMRLAPGDSAAVTKLREMMDRQLAHMVRLIDDLLDVSRISRNKMELRRTRLLLKDVVSTAVETVRPTIDTAGHELTVVLPDEPLHLDADLTRLAQVFGNLLSNSVKYTPPGGHIWLTAEPHAGQVVVTVSDTGIGIPEASLPNIFDMFSQVDRSIERSTGGLGIGLALVKGLVEMHGGTVTATSGGANRGSTFAVRLPLLVSSPELRPESADGSPSGGPARRILVVDDNRDSAESMAEMLQLMGNRLSIAHDGLQAMEAAERDRPEVILMDVGMPRLNGLDATRRIREQPWGRDVVIIALTGWGQEGDRAQSRDAGCDGHLVKPVDFADLEKLLTTLTRTPN